MNDEELISFFFKAHRIRSQGAKQKDLLISAYVQCKSFNIEYWRDYSLLTNTNSTRKPTTNSKNYGRFIHPSSIVFIQYEF